jgi:hypothetical protein
MKFRNKILNFCKTDHFLERQWARSIDDSSLTQSLKFIKTPIYRKEIMIIKPSFLKRFNLVQSNDNAIVIVIKESSLITCYWCSCIERVIRNEKNIRYQIIDYVYNAKTKLKTNVKIIINGD